LSDYHVTPPSVYTVLYTEIYLIQIMLYATSVYHLYTKTYLFFFLWMTENWLHVRNWQITQAIRYYTSACLKALKYWWFSASFYVQDTDSMCTK
jgi:thiol:disulfide interchange protein